MYIYVFISLFFKPNLNFTLHLKLIFKCTRLCTCCEYDKHTLSFEGVQVMPESVCWFSLLQDTEVTQFLHLCFLCLLLPHRDHDLKENKSSIFQIPSKCWETSQTTMIKHPKQTDSPSLWECWLGVCRERRWGGKSLHRLEPQAHPEETDEDSVKILM